MKVYISGKISGLHYNEAAFNFSINENILNAIGHHSVNPMSRKYFKNRLGKLPWSVHMIFDIILLLQCDAIYMQRNWLDSRGARIEYKIAIRLKLKVMYTPVYVMNKAIMRHNATCFLDENFRYKVYKTIEEHEREKLLNLNNHESTMD